MYNQQQMNSQNQQNQQNWQTGTGAQAAQAGQQSLMPEKDMLQTILTDLKRTSREYTTAVTESNCQIVRKTFTDLLNNTLQLQGELYSLMKQQNMYSAASHALSQEIAKQIKQHQQSGQATMQFVQQKLGQLPLQQQTNMMQQSFMPQQQQPQQQQMQQQAQPTQTQQPYVQHQYQQPQQQPYQQSQHQPQAQVHTHTQRQRYEPSHPSSQQPFMPQ